MADKTTTAFNQLRQSNQWNNTTNYNWTAILRTKTAFDPSATYPRHDLNHTYTTNVVYPDPHVPNQLLTYAITLNLRDILHFDDITTDPFIYFCGTGVRHIPDNKAFLSSCNAWCPAPPPATYNVLTQSLDASKAQLKDGVFWLSTPTATVQLEHYFECRFAGPILGACLANMQNGDDAMRDAIALLDRIVNNEHNLAWTPTNLNQIKTKFFGGTPIGTADPGLGDLYAYMNAMALRFRFLVENVAAVCLWQYNPDTVMARMLKLIWSSPFCQGNWQNVCTPVGGYISWAI